MEENNNNEEKASKKIKNALKSVGKIAGKLIMKIPYVKEILIGFVLILLAFGVINSITYLVTQWFMSLFGLDSSTGANATIAGEANKIICINEYGGYDITVENFSEQILQRLEENKVDKEAAGFITDNMDDMIDKYIKAEVKTMYPKTGKLGDVDGLIKIQRASAEKGTIHDLTYKKYDDFMNDTGDGVLNYFSINPETFKLCLATVNTTKYYDANGKEITSMTERNIQLHDDIDYQTSIQGYSTPFNFLLTLHMFSLDEGFMNKFVNDILQKTDPIVLTYVESASITTTEKSYEGLETIVNITEEMQVIVTGNTVEGVVDKKQTDAKIEKKVPINNINLHEYMEPPEYWKEERTTNSGTLHVTKADTWIKTVEKTINTTTPEIRNEGSSEKTVLEKNEPVSREEPEETGFDENNVITVKTKKSDVRISEKTTITSEYRKYTVVDTKNEMNIQEFIDLINSYPKTKNNFKNSPSNIFYRLQQYENTQQHEKIMRYVLFKLNDIDYGVTSEAELDALLGQINNNVGGDYIVHTEIGQELLKITDIETLKKAFSGYATNQKLMEYAQVFLDMQEKYKVNAVFAAAVSITETTAGTNGHAVDGYNNWFSVKSKDGSYRQYGSVEEAIDEFGWTIAEGSNYFTQGRYTVSEIGEIYCVPPENWIEDTRGYMTQMYNAAGIDTSIIFNTASSNAVGKIADLIAWAESYVGESQYPDWNGGYKSSNGTCAAFVKRAYYFNGFGRMNGDCGINMTPIGDKGSITYSDGKADWSQIPVGAYLVIPPGADGSDSEYGHTALYVGNGYVIEAGGSTVQKNKINVDAFSDGGYSYWAIPQEMKTYINSEEYKKLLEAQVTTAKGKGYTSQVTVNGRTYNEYKQASPDYANETYWGGTFAGNACGPTALGIIASGYGINEDPVSIAKYMDNRWGETTMSNIKTTIKDKLGLNYTFYDGTNSGSSVSKIKDVITTTLNSGRPIVIDANNGYYASSSGHYMTLLAINDKGQVYLCNPGSSSKNGWVDLDTLIERDGCGKCVITIDN